ncbi:M16 family metallopeptidase [Streptomyces heilongjiangensis]|uniref:M16 family metallopeptidase n=1 Tax=Streptomyces heilongjiangensis TaxID=945052 RepID=A0ABW1BA24_9ACTN|nr:insulinase family protein [Streptomyces heilongjiangensis]MDC2950376.1 insulinase family protein [Streptomyces heilongjiangensis]
MSTAETFRTVLPNGLDTVLVTVPGAPLAEIRLVLPYARTEPGLAAARELLAAHLGTATTTRDRQAVADLAADLGGEFSTVVTAEQLVLSASVLADGLRGALALLADLVLRPALPPPVARDARRGPTPPPRPAGPRGALRRAQLRHAFGAPHPLVDDTPDGADSPDVRAFHRRAVVPRGAVLLVMSGEAPERVRAAVEAEWAQWTGAGPSGLVLPPFPRTAPTPGRLALHAPDAGQALLLTAGPAVPAPEPGHTALHLAQVVLGGHASSRLTRRLRERHGLSYGVDASIRQNAAGCWLEIECAGAPGTGDRLADEVTACLAELARGGPTPEEVRRARRYAAGFTRFALATRAEEASALAGFVAAGLPVDWLTTYPDALAAVTDDRVDEAAAHYLDPSRTLVATLDHHPS